MEQHATNNREADGWVPFGWQGINLSVPNDWQLVLTDGNHKKGYLRLVDETAVRLEMRWEDDKGEADLEQIVSRYVRELKKKARRERAEIKLQRRINVTSFAKSERAAECYSWESESKVISMATQCARCKRIVHIQILGQGAEGVRSIARRVFGSLRDHPDGQLERWAFYDVQFAVPLEFNLVKPDLKTGCISMIFERGSEKLEFARLSLAHVMLQQNPLAKWLRDYTKKGLRFFSVTSEAGQLKSHEAVGFSGRKYLLNDPVGLIRGRLQLRLIAWNCDRNDKVFLCSWISRRSTDKAFADLVGEVVCHED